MDEEIDDFGDFENFQVPASHEPTISNNEVLSIQKGPKKSVMLTKTDLSSSSVQCDSAKPITVKQVQQDKCDTISNTSASISVQHDTYSKKPDPKSCTASNKVGDCVGKLDETSSLQSSKIGGVSSSPQSSLYQRSDSTFLATKRDVIDNMAHSVNEARSCWDHHRSSKDSAVDETCDGINADRNVIRVLLRNAVDTVVEREQTEQCSLVSEEQLASTKGLPVEPKKGHEENGNTGNLSDIKDDFGEFSTPEAGCDVQPLPLLTVNGITCLNEQQTIEGESIDDDFGDFDQAAFNEEFSEGFANFKAAPSPITSSVLLSCPGNTTSSDEVRPLTIDLFRATISAIFTTEDTENIDDKRHIHSETENVDGASFVASVKRDLSRCENVDNWPCVVFRYDNSMTRKGLLSALCINETPANCPRFAIDCFSKAFLQPVKQSSLFVKENSSPSMGQNPVERPNISGQEKLSDAAKEVLNKIPDLSFMKAEVLTFPTAGLNLAPVVTSTVKEELIASNRSAGPLAPFDLSSPVLSSNGILTDRATGMHCCEFCGYMSSNRGNVTYHIRSKHTGERPFGCPFCDYRSSRKTTLRLHMNRHRPFSDVRNCRSPSSGGRSSTPSAAPSISPVSAISPGPAPATSQASSVSKISTVSPVSPISSMSSVTPRTALTAGIPYGAMELIMGTNIDLISGQTR